MTVTTKAAPLPKFTILPISNVDALVIITEDYEQFVKIGTTLA